MVIKMVRVSKLINMGSSIGDNGNKIKDKDLVDWN